MVSIKKNIIFLITLILLGSTTLGQESNDKEAEKADRFFWGLFFDEYFFVTGQGGTTATLFPFAGYRPHPKIHVGMGAFYRYKKIQTNHLHFFGSSPFLEYIPVKQIHNSIPFGIITHAEHQVIFSSVSKQPDHYSWLGGGLHSSINENTSFNLLILANFHAQGPLPSGPIWRFSIIF